MARDNDGREYRFSPDGYCDRYYDDDTRVPESARRNDDDHHSLDDDDYDVNGNPLW